jgi:hypothetical protein
LFLSWRFSRHQQTGKRQGGRAGDRGSLTLVHLLGIYFTGTSVNPAVLSDRLAARGDALAQVWVFIVAPLAGVCSGRLGLAVPVREIHKS